MRRNNKKKSGVYASLEASGLLENGTGKQIEQAKIEYWRDYRIKYNKVKRKENKSFQILFNFKEAKIIASRANKYHCSLPGYIKQSALADKQNIIDWISAGEIRELVFLHHTTLLNLTEEKKLEEDVSNHLLNQASEIEKKILDFFSLLK